MKTLVLNAWSSSLKYKVFADIRCLASWNIEKITDHKLALKQVLALLVDKKKGCLKSLHEIDAIGHRVVHGGEYFQNATLITPEVIKKIQKCSDLAPLHNPANLACIQACKILMPQVKQVAIFDTAFHQTMKPENYLYALPYKYYSKYKIRRYGFHWISHQYVYDKLVTSDELRVTRKKPQKVITCHVWNWVSVTAIQNGKVIETSMGMTPMEGVIMGTRSGNIDPWIITYLMKHEKLSPNQIENILNKESGVLGISQKSSDMRDILSWYKKKDSQCTLALHMYINAIVKYIWSYTALMNWVNAIILTGAVMERSSLVRKLLMEKLWRLGTTLDTKKNDFEVKQQIISTKNSDVMVVVIPTNEELLIAEQTKELLVGKLK